MSGGFGDAWRAHGDAPALHLEPGGLEGHALGYAELHRTLQERIATLRRWQRDLPAKAEHRRPLVAIEAGKPLNAIIDALACLELGIDALLVNAAWWPRERDALFERLRPQWATSRRDGDAEPRPTGLAARTAPHTDPHDTVRHDTVEHDTERYGAADEEPLLWLASAGSDGDPTPYAFRHHQVASWAQPQPRPDGPVVITGEIAHLPTWRSALGALGGGAEVVLSDRAHLAAVLSQRRLGELYATPVLLRRALRQLQRRDRPLVGIDRSVLHQGQVRAHERGQWSDRFGGSVHSWVSATEAGGWLLQERSAAPGVELHIEHTEHSEHNRHSEHGAGPHGAGPLRCGGAASAGHSAAGERPSAGWDSGDQAEVLADGQVRWRGRRRDRFIADGVEVDPLEVEEALAAHPLVAEVAVAPRPHPARTNLVVAVLVPTDPEWPPFLEDLAEVTAALNPAARPQALAIVEDLPTNAAGAVHRRLVNYEEASR